MLGKQRRDVLALAARNAHARERGRLASSALYRASSEFKPRPAMLLLPFAAGVLGALVATGRSAPRRSRSPMAVRNGALRDGALHDRAAQDTARDTIAWGSLASSALTLWNTARPLREAMADPRNRAMWADMIARRPVAVDVTRRVEDRHATEMPGASAVDAESA